MPFDSTGFDVREAPAPAADVVPMLGRLLLEVFGPNGENWYQRLVCDPFNHERVCLIGAARVVATGSPVKSDDALTRELVTRIHAALPPSDRTVSLTRLMPAHRVVALWNDDPDRTFEDIRQLCFRLR